MEEMEESGYIKKYSEKGFWRKLAKYAAIAGKQVVEKALWLFYAAQRPETPVWAKTIIYSALGYFIFPADAIPDVIPIGGFLDDLGVLAAAIGSVLFYINKDVKEKAAQKLQDWFG